MNMLYGIWKKIGPDRIVFSGDTEQLPPIGVGDLFRDLLSLNYFPVTTLAERFRQQGSANALIDAIEDVENMRVPVRYDDSFRHVCATTGIANKVMEILFPIYDYDDFCKGRVMVIASKNDSVDLLSSMIRNHLIPDSKISTTINKQKFMFYDKDIVRCDENIYDGDFELLRGTPGVVRHNVTKNSMVVYYDNGCSKPLKDHKVEHNYATTCHKSQGSEADHVIFALEPHICVPLHKRNLLYTAMTRAKKTLTIVGPMDVVRYMVSQDPVSRLTTIKEHLRHIPVE
jgi:exodeoxyribonuclease V alpha subunit